MSINDIMLNRQTNVYRRDNNINDYNYQSEFKKDKNINEIKMYLQKTINELKIEVNSEINHKLDNYLSIQQMQEINNKFMTDMKSYVQQVVNELKMQINLDINHDVNNYLSIQKVNDMNNKNMSDIKEYLQHAVNNLKLELIPEINIDKTLNDKDIFNKLQNHLDNNLSQLKQNLEKYNKEYIDSLQLSQMNLASSINRQTQTSSYEPLQTQQKPVIQKPVIQKPVIQKPVIQKPVIQKPVIQQPVTQQPVTQQPVTQQPVIQQPIELVSQPTNPLNKNKTKDLPNKPDTQNKINIKITDDMISNVTAYSKVLELKQKISFGKNLTPSLLTNNTPQKKKAPKLVAQPAINNAHIEEKKPIVKITDNCINNNSAYKKVLELQNNLKVSLAAKKVPNKEVLKEDPNKEDLKEDPNKEDPNKEDPNKEDLKEDLNKEDLNKEVLKEDPNKNSNNVITITTPQWTDVTKKKRKKKTNVQI